LLRTRDFVRVTAFGDIMLVCHAIRPVWICLLAVLFMNPLSGIADGTQDDVQRALKRLEHFEDIHQWSVESNTHSITLVSRFPVNTSSAQSLATPTESTAAAEADAAVIQPKPFRIEIHFLPFPDYAALALLQEQRRTFVEPLNRDALDLEAEPLPAGQWESLLQSLDQTPNPTHVAAESLVYFRSDLDNRDLSFEPSDGLRDCVWMLHRLGYLFSEILR
jgi:hypothetical protein